MAVLASYSSLQKVTSGMAERNGVSLLKEADGSIVITIHDRRTGEPITSCRLSTGDWSYLIANPRTATKPTGFAPR